MLKTKEYLKDISVLYVEDEEYIRNITSRLMLKFIKNVITAEDGLDGLEKFKQNRDNIDLIITDISMPEMDGFEMCLKIREIDTIIPIIITTAHNDIDFLQNSIDVGVSAYSIKPIDMKKLISAITKATETFELKMELKNINLYLQDRVDENIKQIKSILDTQDNLILVTTKDKIDDVNKRFLEFFNSSSLDDFSKKYNSISELFLKNKDFFNTDLLSQKDDWIEYLIKIPKQKRLIKFLNNQDRVFTVNINKYEHKGEHYIISFTDITEFYEEASLLEYKATHDPLTRLFNRQKFFDIIDYEFKRVRRYDEELSVILFDIDHFKVVNDTYGHDIGDEVLINLSKLAKDTTRGMDSVIRWGGEEFLVVLPKTHRNNAQKVAEKLRIEIESFYKKDIPKVTASFGVAQALKDDDENTLIKRADNALYSAKKSGRNMVILK